MLHHELVAHGDGSGDTLAVAFSNEIGSHQSSLGLFRTDEPYTGRYGYSLRLSGLEPGFNDNARERAIVVHGSSYVSHAHRRQVGEDRPHLGLPGAARGRRAAGHRRDRRRLGALRLLPGRGLAANLALTCTAASRSPMPPMPSPSTTRWLGVADRT